MAALARQSLPQLAAESLGRRILQGELPPGERLPSQDELSVAFAISRPALREALKLLASKGLIQSRPRAGTHVLPRSEWKLLDSDVMRWQSEAAAPGAYLAGLVEIRRIIEPAASRLAAERRSATQLSTIEDALTLLERSVDTANGFADADVAFHRAVLRAAGNEFVDQIGSLIAGALHSSDTVTAGRAANRVAAIPIHRRLFDAISDRDPQAAEQAMVAIIEMSRADLARALDVDARNDTDSH